MSKWRLLIISMMIAIFATACTLVENQQYKSEFGTYGMRVLLSPNSNSLVLNYVFRQTCVGNYVCTGNLLHDNVQVSGTGAAEWHEATHYYNDLGAHLNQQIVFETTGPHGYCLTLHKDLALDLNWENRKCPDNPIGPGAGGGSGGGGGGSW